MAPVEFMMALPILMFMLALIIGIGSAGITASLTNTEARKNAFNSAVNHRTADEFTRFVPLESKFTADIVAGNASRAAKVPFIFGSPALTSTAQVSVLRNTWSHQELPMTDSFRADWYVKIGVGGGGGSLTSILNALNGLRSGAGNFLGNLTEAAVASAVEPEGLSQAREQLAQERQKNDAARKQLQQEIAQAKSEIQAIDAEIKQLNDDLAKANREENAKPDDQKKPDDLKKLEDDTKKRTDQLQKDRQAKQAQIREKEKELSFRNRADNF
jgi:hypothetical protein